MTQPVFTPDDFDAWRELPITRLVMSGFDAIAHRAEAEWKEAAFSADWLTAEGRERQQYEAGRVKAQIKSYREMANITLDDILAANGLEKPAEEGR